jgi:hypothetical protein
MATGYIRNDITNDIANGNIINADDLDGEFDAIQAAYDATTGHAHDGTVGGGAPIGVLGPTQDIVVTNTVLRPKTDNTVDLGSNTLEFKDLWLDGTANIDSLVADTADINGGTIDGATIATSDITVGAGKTLNVSAGTLTLANDQISGDKVEGGTINAITINTLGSTTVNATTVDTTNIEATNLKAKDGTTAGSIADSTGVVTLASSVLTTTDINGGTIDGATIATSDITVGSGKTLNVSAGTLTLADNQISGDKVEGGTINAITINTLGSTTGNITNVNATTIDTTNLEVTAIKAKDGTAAATIANSTGVITVASSVLTTTDINGGTVDGTTIGGSSAAAGTFTTATATTGNITTVNATTVDTTNIEVTAIKAKDGTASATIADSTGVVTVASSVLTTTDINGGTIDGVTIGGASAGAITGTTITATGDVTIADKIIHSGDTNTSIRFPAADTVTVETDGAERLRVDSSGEVGIGTDAPANLLHLKSTSAILRIEDTDAAGAYSTIASLSSGSLQISADEGNTANSSSIRFDVDGTERMRIDSAGNVGIGTANPASIVGGTGTSPVLSIGGTDTTLTNDDKAGSLSFITNDPSYTVSYADGVTGEIASISETLTGGGYGLSFYTGVAGGTRGERVRINRLGNVGIGTTSPAAMLDITSNNAGLGPLVANNRLRFTDTDPTLVAGQTTGSVEWYTSDTTNPGVHAYIGTLGSNDGGGALAFGTGVGGSAAERMRIDSAGNVGIGTTSPAEQLHITGNLCVGSAVLATPSGSTPMYTARAWVYFDGSASGTPVIGGGNVSSVTDHSVGNYTINFTTAMPDTNYNVVASCSMVSVAVSSGYDSDRGTKTTSAVSIVSFTSSNNEADRLTSVSIFR